MQLDVESLLANIREAVYLTDKQRRIIFWNRGAEQITGYLASEVIGQKCRDNILIHLDAQGHSLCDRQCPLMLAIKEKRITEDQVFLHHKDGHRVPVHIRVVPLFDRQGRVTGSAEFFFQSSAMENLHQRIRELENLAMLDPLTQLPNRHHLEPELESRFHEMERMDLAFGLLFMDLDHFKRINDTYGHLVGDKILRTVANTLKAAVRPFDLVGRWGGEEFISIIRRIEANKLMEVGDRLRILIGNSTVQYEKESLSVTVSLGATMAMKTDTVSSLIQRADQLMYESKRLGRNRVTVG